MKRIFKYFVVLLTTFFILLYGDNVFAQDKIEVFQNINLQLAPTAESYELEEDFRGKLRYKNEFVAFRATISNNTDSTITVMHPGACLPDSINNPPPWTIEELIGKSEILIYITKPDGNKVMLRERTNPYFEGSEDSTFSSSTHLLIPPDNSRSFYVGWFFMNARGRWLDDVLAAHVFLERGTFSVQLLYRNVFTNCKVPNRNYSNTLWIGTLLSNEVEIKIH